MVNTLRGLVTMEPFILKEKEISIESQKASDDQVYDENLQLWILRKTGSPLISYMQDLNEASQFGETLQTNNREGVDQPTHSRLTASQFGETSMTKTNSEGVDQTGEIFGSSQFRETLLAQTHEGADQSELALINLDVTNYN